MNCKECQKQIMWMKMVPSEKTPNPKSAPIEVEPHPNGNIVVNWKDRVYRFATPDEREFARANHKNLYINHFVTCPFAKKFRKKKEGA